MKLLNRNLRLKEKLLVYFLIFAVIPSVTITAVTIVSNDSTVSESENELTSLQLKTLAGLGDQYADVVNSWMHRQYQTADIIASDPAIRSNVESLNDPTNSSNAIWQINTLFDSWVGSSEGVEEMMLLNYTSGQVILSNAIEGRTNTTGNKASDPYYIGAIETQGTSLQTGKPYFKEIYYSSTLNDYSMTFSHVIRPLSSDTALPQAVLAVRIDANTLWDLLAPRTTSNQPINEFYQNIGLGTTGEAYLIRNDGIAISRSRFTLTDNQFILKQDFSNADGFQQAKEKGYLLGPEKAYNLDQVYGAYIYLGTLTGTDNRPSYLVNKLDYNLPWILAIEIDQSEVLTPINHIHDQQNTSYLFILGIIALISIAVIVFSLFIANSFAKPISKISEVSETIASGDLTIELENSKSNDEIGQLQSSFYTMINFLKPSIESISDVAKTLAASAQGMASSSEEVNASSEEMSSVSQQISKGAQQQTEYLTKSMTQMEEIKKSFSEKISGIKIASDLIENISTQVNMLALNASIEAARAGEFGRGFAVVADNIRRLADDAKSSVDRVNLIIEDLTTTISNGMEALSDSVTSVTSVAEETSSGAEEASAATEEQAATMQELSASAQELAKVSNDLEAIVVKFKI